MEISKYPLYSVLGLDLGVTETDLVFEDVHLNIIELFHTNNAGEALQKLEEFKVSFPKAMLTNNAAIARFNLEYQVNEMKKKLPALENKEAHHATSN
jgi:hypothetical protein